jgi:DNA-directed RNA polymerase specialized sigma54-like protein
MDIKLAQKMTQTQSLVMTQQLQQAIKLLQLSRAELIEEVHRELEANPVLGDDETDPQARADVGLGDYVNRRGENGYGDGGEINDKSRDINARKEERKAQEVDWEQFLENRTLQQPTYATRSGFEELPPIEQSLTKAQSLAEHLRWQLQMSDFSEDERQFAEMVIASLDENGLLDLKASYRESVDELEAELEKNPSSKFAVFNLGIFHEKMGNLDESRDYLRRFLGDDLGAEERRAGAEAAGVLRRVRDGLEELVRDLGGLGDAASWSREALSSLRGKEVTLRDQIEGISVVLRGLKSSAGSRSGALVRLIEKAEQILRLDADMSRLLQLRPPVSPAARRSVFEKAIVMAEAGKLADAQAALARFLGTDVEPHERARALDVLHTLGQERPDGSEAEARDGTELSIELLAERSGLDPDDALEVLRLIQNFDPIGVAARDLRECLRVQAEAFGFDELELAIIDRHMHNLEKHNYQAIARDLKVPVEEIYEAAKEIQKLESRPARNFVDTDDRSISITPDVYVTKEPRARLIAEGVGISLLGSHGIELHQPQRFLLQEYDGNKENPTPLLPMGQRIVLVDGVTEHDLIVESPVDKQSYHHTIEARLRSPVPPLAAPNHAVAWRVYDDWNAHDNDRGMQRLYVNEGLARKLLKDPNAKDWVGDKLRNAHWLIRAIEQRRKTIIRVTDCIVGKQHDFFEKGGAHLRPMILRDVAEAVEMHESTISRVTTNKYVHTPQGIFELKYFFNSAIKRSGSDEEDIASESVKQAIKRIIDDEDKQNPLSDQAIVELLAKKEGIQIARRTVAKYREMLGILASGKRKKLF